MQIELTIAAATNRPVFLKDKISLSYVVASVNTFLSIHF